MSDRKKQLLREMHDLALKKMPEGASHEPCDICKADTASQDSPNQATGGENVETFTKEEYEKALAAALKPLQDEIASLKAAKANDENASAIESAVEAAKDEAKKEFDELQVRFDKAELAAGSEKERADKAEQEVADIKSYLEVEAKKVEDAKELASRMEERVEKVKEVAKFNDDQIETKKDRWAAMEQADFDALLDEYKSVAETAAATPTEPNNEVESAMAAVAPETAKSKDGKSALGFISEARKAGFVPGKRF